MTEGQLLAQLLELNGHPSSMLDTLLTELDERTRAQHEQGFTREAVARGSQALREVARRGWETSFFGDRSPDRHHLTSLVTPLLGEGTHVIIGDTPNDGLAADSANIPFIAVATGAYTASDLQSTSAIIVVEDLERGLADVLGAISELNQRS